MERFLKNLIRHGTLHCVIADKSGALTFGDGAPPEVTVLFHNSRAARRMALRPVLAFAEGYMNGEITLEKGSLSDLFTLIFSNAGSDADKLYMHLPPFLSFLDPLLRTRNRPPRAGRNVARHYDLKDDFYELFLDSDRQYSCGYWGEGVNTLEEAQAAKRRHIAAKLRLTRPGLRVLDIGSGWGGLAIELVRDHGAIVEGITLSQRQHAIASARAEEAGVGGACRFHLRDYRHQTGDFDRIVSVGMFEHVGAGNYAEYFDCVRRLLRDDGVALLHSIVTLTPKTLRGDPFILKYIFPGGQIPSLSDVTHHSLRAGLFVTDTEIWRLHYARTLEAWHERFAANRERVLELYDERLYRMWSLYFLGTAAAFRHIPMAVGQIQMTPPLHADTVPVTRDYMYR
ncbi:MAG: cyclopropane-fatty-acyl-phospholipid synthase family protein [Alphaproteobacteria bacterium]|nr:cyclopropane-fatty-acyl-phospholipid synthase family protein [Alphaproteobacteria bacterium]MDA7983092.1 cyclopropane-fatty-acyl-phospholipid synthase family protein [Alphaproteobacteria bacterium]MDA7984370.1 cyclopropane-fatty-acyl-phospholipid synthase family protein [Alphaproteobacteria bacterium]MDA7987201.1 cyclopropane-fatty-acyl-phospholipid synthase family protein [Alphaproteobacteria bacterium]MDA7988684.1 cyclopropane-fatty-acyl-phospholipid synthase family protein [Alphaproteobac